MNKIKTIAITALACVALCGTTMAAPAPAHHHAPAPRPCLQPPPPPPPHLECHHHEANGLAVLGAAVIGGIVGAICN